MIESKIGKLTAGHDLTMQEMAETVGLIMDGRCSEAEIGLLLTALRAKGETVPEVAGAATAMRAHMTPIRSSRQTIVDTCGTGGDASGTFNISTAAAFVTAACGVAVAKHGNRAISSKSGSADVLAELGIDIEAKAPVVERCLDELGFCFCYAPLLHPSMKNVAAARRKLGVPTVFNLLGPLCNPASAPYQLIGVGRPEVQPLIAEALALLGTTRSLVVSGSDGLDEVTLNGSTNVIEVTAGDVKRFTWTPADFGLVERTLDSIRVDDARGSAEIVRQVLAGERGVAREIVIANAAAALWTAGRAKSTVDCAGIAAEAIDNGAASELLSRLVQLSHA